MHPTIQYQLGQSRVAELHRQADRARQTRAATQARRQRSRRRLITRGARAGRLFALLGGRRPAAR
jgi:hypothetical protein